MLIPILIQAKWRNVALWKCFPLAVLLTISGTLGTYLWFFIENHWIGGTSFFGAVFVVPVLFLAVSKLLRIPYGQIMDLCAPAECAMLAIMKIQCLLSGCCEGRVLGILENGTSIVFPSQIAELINALVILVALLIMSRKKRFGRVLYPWYMIIYGCSRFVLNIFREEWVTTKMIMPFGNIWSLVAIGVGVAWLFFQNKRKVSSDEST